MPNPKSISEIEESYRNGRTGGENGKKQLLPLRDDDDDDDDEEEGESEEVGKKGGWGWAHLVIRPRDQVTIVGILVRRSELVLTVALTPYLFRLLAYTAEGSTVYHIPFVRHSDWSVVRAPVPAGAWSGRGHPSHKSNLSIADLFDSASGERGSRCL